MTRFSTRALATALASGLVCLAASNPVSADDDFARADNRRARIGLEVADQNGIELSNQDARVGLGSYWVNSTGCNDCHTWPNYSPAGNPFNGQAKQVNVANYLAGGRTFALPGETVCSRNITPAPGTTNPAGLSREDFIYVMRTGCDPRDANFRNPRHCELLQVMPWPNYRAMTSQDLNAMYDYLSALPHADPGAQAQCVVDPQGIATQ
jgi:hypothetical protein